MQSSLVDPFYWLATAAAEARFFSRAICLLLVVGLLGSGIEISNASQLLDGFVKYVTLDYVRAAEILKPLAQQGDADAQQFVGFMYAEGKGFQKDNSLAAYWLFLAAEQGKVNAQFALGIMHRDGAGVPKDRESALKWLRRAAGRQHSSASNALGELYAASPATSIEHLEAAIWFERAALMGNGKAQYNLGVLYALGHGVKQSDVQAYKWLELSAGSTLGEQREVTFRALILIRERMMPSQVDEAKRLVRDWMSCALAAPSC